MFYLTRSLCRIWHGFYYALTFSLLFTTASVRAEGAPPFSVLLRQALTQAPSLLEQSANVRAANADIQQAKVFRNPSISGLTENLNTRSDYVQHTLMLTQPFEVGGKRSARIEARNRDLLVAEARDKQTQVLFSAELASAYAAAEAMTARVNVAEENVARASDDLRAAQALVDAGREAQLRLSQAQANFSSAEALVQVAKANQIAALESLSAISGASTPYTGLAASLTAQVLQNFQTTMGDLNKSPAIIRAQAEREAYNAQIKVEEKRWIPDIGVSAGVRYFEGVNESVFVIGLSSEIPIFDQNRGGISAAQERALAAEARLNAVTLEAGANQRTAIAQVNASDRRMSAAKQSEQAADQAYQLAKVGYEAGKTSLIELLLTRKSLTDAKLMTIETSYSLVSALANLAAAEGRIAFGELK